MAGRKGLKRILVRHYCIECGSRVTPFDKFEERTESPEVGKNETVILLKSYNAEHREDRIAWCFSCKSFKRAERLGESEILELYSKRRGVRIRA